MQIDCFGMIIVLIQSCDVTRHGKVCAKINILNYIFALLCSDDCSLIGQTN